ncbi:MAG: PqiC family protein [Pseudomonadota bacterium]
MSRLIQRCVIAVLVTVTAAGCMNLGPTASQDTRYYLLEPVSATDGPQTPPALSADTVIGLGPVTLASYLDRPQIVTRMRDNMIRVDEFNRWGEPLGDAVTRALVDNMSLMAGDGRVLAFPWKRSQQVTVRVAVAVSGFEADDTGAVTLRARWQLLDGDGGRLVERRTEITRASGSDYGQVAAAMSGLISDLAGEIYQAIADLPQP